MGDSEFHVVSWIGSEDACIEAQTSGPREQALREAMHYAAQYAEDSPVVVVEQVEVARLGYPSGNYGPTSIPPADAALADALQKISDTCYLSSEETQATLSESMDKTICEAAAALRARSAPTHNLTAQDTADIARVLCWLKHGDTPPAAEIERIVHRNAELRGIVDDLRARAVPDADVDLWGFLRDVLKRGAAIESQFSQQGYETFISEIEAAARKEDKRLRAMLAASKGWKP